MQGLTLEGDGKIKPVCPDKVIVTQHPLAILAG